MLPLNRNIQRSLPFGQVKFLTQFFYSTSNFLITFCNGSKANSTKANKPMEIQKITKLPRGCCFDIKKDEKRPTNQSSEVRTA